MTNTTEQNTNGSPEIRPDDPPNEVEDSGVVEDKEDTSVAIFSGDELSLAEAREITRARRTQLVVIAGPVACGKTTMLASIYELFQKGKLGSLTFAGSRTLLAFEMCCHEARISSGRAVPETERTKWMEYHLLHLRMVHDTACSDLLLTNISGEVFENIRDSSLECEKHTVFLRADRFAVVIDGAKLADSLLRPQVLSDAVGMLRRCLDTGMLGKHSYVDVVFAKWDLVTQWVAEDNKAQAHLDDIWANKFVQPFEARLGILQRWHVAARPNPAGTSGLEFGHGLEHLLTAWAGSAPPSRIHIESGAQQEPCRQIDRQLFIWRRRSEARKAGEE